MDEGEMLRLAKLNLHRIETTTGSIEDLVVITKKMSVMSEELQEALEQETKKIRGKAEGD